MSETPQPADAGPDVHINPALIAAGVMLIGMLLDHLQPLPLPAAAPLKAIGIALASIAIWAFVQYQRADTGIRPDEPASVLITGGPYRYSRNPQYLVLALLQVTVACWLDKLWILLLVPVTLFVIDRYAVVREEHYLEQRFGQQYRDYRRRVRRWL
ncbi:MAG: methyltransferase [Pseudomonadota bacterium]